MSQLTAVYFLRRGRAVSCQLGFSHFHIYFSFHAGQGVKSVSGLSKNHPILTASLWRCGQYIQTALVEPQFQFSQVNFTPLKKKIETKNSTTSFNEFPKRRSWKHLSDHNREAYTTSLWFDAVSSLSLKVWQQCCDVGQPYWRSLLLYRINNRLKIYLFIFFSGRAKEERRRGLKRECSNWNFISRLGWPFWKSLSDVVLREIHCVDLGLAGSPPWRRHSSVFQHGEPMTWHAVWNWGWGREMGCFNFISFFFLFFPWCVFFLR